MNIFYLDNDQTLCAQYHTDKHVVKMNLEYAQLLSGAHRLLDDIQGDSIYKLTHKNHPSAIWTRTSKQNYEWLFDLWIELMKEYEYRYSKIHASARLIPYLINPPMNILDKGFTEPLQAVPDEYKSDSSISTYRLYYNKDKRHLFNWKHRDIPHFITE